MTINNSIDSKPLVLTGLILILSLLLPSFAALAVGPAASRHTDKPVQQRKPYHGTRLDVVIPVFDPNIPRDPDDYEKKGIWPELRRAEATLFAVRTRDAIEATQYFGAVRVTPNDAAAAELYVTGKIIQSTSEVVEIKIKVQDISLKYWSTGKTFKYRVREYDLSSIRTQKRDPYAPVYDQIASYLVALLKKKRQKDLRALRDISTLVFARSFSNEEFSPYFRKTRRTNKLKYLPADDDPKYRVISDIRARDQLFIDDLQEHYRDFVYAMQDSYGVWQQQSFTEAKQYRLAREKSRRELAGGIFLAAAAVAINNQRDGSGSTSDKLKKGAVIAGGVAALVLVYKSFRDNAASKQHVDALNELGKSVDAELASAVITYENQTVELTGNAEEQYQQWQAFLAQVFLEETTPNIQL